MWYVRAEICIFMSAQLFPCEERHVLMMLSLFDWWRQVWEVRPRFRSTGLYCVARRIGLMEFVHPPSSTIFFAEISSFFSPPHLSVYVRVCIPHPLCPEPRQPRIFPHHHRGMCTDPSFSPNRRKASFAPSHHFSLLAFYTATAEILLTSYMPPPAKCRDLRPMTLYI